VKGTQDPPRDAGSWRHHTCFENFIQHLPYYTPHSSNHHSIMQSISRAIPSVTRTCARSCYCRPLPKRVLLNRLQAQHLPAIRQTIRYNSSASSADATPNITAAKPHRPAPHRDPNTPVYELTFTCKACLERSSHTVSKQGYHKGTTIITCSGCKNLHLISDHLRVKLVVGRCACTVLTDRADIHG